jgi:hypothetical protein
MEGRRKAKRDGEEMESKSIVKARRVENSKSIERL